MITAAVCAWLLSGFAGWAWIKWDDWISFPTLRRDITLCTLAGGVCTSVLGLMLLIGAAASADHWPFGIRCPVVLFKGTRS